METRISTLLVLVFLAMQVNAQDKVTTYVRHEKAIKRHNNMMFKHANIMKKEAHNSDDLFNRKSYLKRARKIKAHATKAKAYLTKWERGEKSVKEQETKFNKTIEHYDKILQEEFQVEKELDMPASDRHKLESHLAIILDEINELREKD